MLWKSTDNKKEQWREAVEKNGCAENKKAASQTGISTSKTEDWKTEGPRTKEKFYKLDIMLEKLEEDRSAMKT